MNAHVPIGLFGILLTNAGCADDAAKTKRPHRSGAWFATDPHVHSAVGSNDTDPESTLETIASVASERGISMVVITDHSNSAGSMDCPTGDVEDCPNQGPEFPALDGLDGITEYATDIRIGVEVSPIHSLDGTSEATGHIGCIPSHPGAFENSTQPVIDRPAGDIAGGEGVDWCQSQGGFAIVNHPYSVAGWLDYDWSSSNYDAIEVFNGGGRFDGGDWKAVTAWACDIALGRSVVPVGGSDTHRATTESPPPGLLDQSIGYPTTWVRANTHEDVLHGLIGGHTVVSDPTTRLDAIAWTSEDIAGPGQRLDTRGRTAHIEAIASVTETNLVLELVDLSDNACIDDPRSISGDPPTLNPKVLLSEPLEPGKRTSHTLRIDSNHESRLVAWVRPLDPTMMGQSGAAIAASIHITP